MFISYLPKGRLGPTTEKKLHLALCTLWYIFHMRSDTSLHFQGTGTIRVQGPGTASLCTDPGALGVVGYSYQSVSLASYWRDVFADSIQARPRWQDCNIAININA